MEPRKEKVKSALLSQIESVKLGDLIRTEEKNWDVLKEKDF